MVVGWWRALGVLALCASGGAGLLPLAAQTASGTRVERQGPLRREVPAAATTVTIAFRVTHGRSGAVRLQGAVELPHGWRSVTSEAPFTLGRGRGELRLVGVAVPATTAAGLYFVRYRVHTVPGARDGATAPEASDSVLVVVPVRRELDLEVDDAPAFVAAGGEYRTTFRVTNRGNVPSRIRLELGRDAGFAVHPEATAVELAPGEVRPIPVVVATPRHLDATTRHRLALTAVAVEDSSARAVAASMVEVIPRGDAGTETTARRAFPLRLGLRASPNGAAAPFAFSGSGPLGPGGARLSLLARGAGAAGSPFAERDVYRLDLRSRALDLALGDQVYALSPLTGTGRFGFGGGGRVALGPLVARGFAQWDRRADFRREASGGFLGLRLGGFGELGANYLDRAAAGAPLWSVRTRLTPSAGHEIDAEYGLGTVRPGDAYAVMLRGSRPRWGYEVRSMRADSAFRAASGTAAQDYASLALRPWRTLRLEASASAVDRSHAGTFVFSPREQRLYRGLLGYGASTIEVRRSEQRRDTAPEGGSRRDESVRLQVALRGRRVWLQPFGELGRTEVDSLDDRAPFHRLGLAAGATSGGGGSVALSLESFRVRHVGSDVTDTRLTAELTAALAVTRGTRLRFLAQGNRFGGVARQGQWSGLVDATVEQDLPFGHMLAARARMLEHRGVTRRSRAALMVEYAIPLRVPLPSPDAGARLAGRVYDVESRRGVSDAIVRVGEQVVVTDRSGRWAVAGLLPGVHRVVLDPRSLRPGQVAVASAPAEVDLTTGAHSRIDLGVTRGARLSGRVLRYDFASNASLTTGTPDVEEHGGVAGLVVELRSGATVLRRVTDAAGAFEFTGLPAGRWCAVVAGALPEHHYLERDTVALELAAGHPNELTLRVLPRVRRVQMLTDADVSLDADASPRSERRQPAPTTGAPVTTSRPSGPLAPIRRRYTVTRFDVSLMYVARFMYGDASLWPKIWVANRHQLKSPDVIEPGQVLLVPEPAPLTEEERAAERAYHARRAAEGGAP